MFAAQTRVKRAGTAQGLPNSLGRNLAADDADLRGSGGGTGGVFCGLGPVGPPGPTGPWSRQVLGTYMALVPSDLHGFCWWGALF